MNILHKYFDPNRVFDKACNEGDTKTLGLLLNIVNGGSQPWFSLDWRVFYFASIRLLQALNLVPILSLNNSKKIVSLLLEDKRVDVNIKNKYGQTQLHTACQEGNAEMVKLLLEDKRVDANAKNTDGRTPLLIACEKGHVEVVKLLLKDNRVDVDVGQLEKFFKTKNKQSNELSQNDKDIL